MNTNSTPPLKLFPLDFQSAREGFRQRLKEAGGALHTIGIAAKGPAGEELAIEVGWFGTDRPDRVFVHSSGLHGVEGFAGSAIQQACLEEGMFNAARLPSDAGVLILHVLNPFGMAWLRRWNENNVDLNRNFRYPGMQYPPPVAPELDALFNPASAPGFDLFWLRAFKLIWQHGSATVRQATACGQCVNLKGLFYSGRVMQEGPTKLAAFLRTRLSGVREITAIDVHTGLGTFGEDCLLIDGRFSGEVRDAARATFGERVQALSKQGIAYSTDGVQQDLYTNEFPGVRTFFLTQEFGTYPAARVAKALREENRWHWYGEGGLDHWSKRDLVEAFNPRSDKWRIAVVNRGRAVAELAIELAFR